MFQAHKSEIVYEEVLKRDQEKTMTRMDLSRVSLEEEALKIASQIVVQFKLGTDIARKWTEANKSIINMLVTKSSKLREQDEKLQELLEAPIPEILILL